MDSIRNRILALALLGTLLPAAITLGIAYAQNRSAIATQVTENLHSEATQTARAVSVWLKERIYDLRIFAASEEVLNNLNRYAIGQGSIPSVRLREYLRSLHQRSPDFEQLMVLDGQGRVIATSAPRSRTVDLPAEWQKMIRQENQLVGDAYWDATTGRGNLIVAVPVVRADGRLIGAFAAEVNLSPVQALLRSFSDDSVGAVYLTGQSGQLLASSKGISDSLLRSKIPATTLDRLSREEHRAISYRNPAGGDAIGILEPVPQLRWAIVAEMPEAEAFATVTRFRNTAIVVVILLLAIVGWTAFRLGLLIVRPLERLAMGAAEVSTGDLDVDLPDTGAGEVGALTGVFNHMVRRVRMGRHELATANDALRAKNNELERLSVTDGLTGLTNHRALMQRLQEEGERSRRTDRPFAVLMADVDFFKQYNDEFGHPAGDEVLKKMASILKEATRNVDCVARYGGEEFAVILPETAMDGALEVAERIRAKVAGAKFEGRQVTLSIGVAEFPKDADTTQKIMSVADKALYEAKRGGRNQVARLKPPSRKQKLPAATPRKPVRKKK